MNGGYKMKRVLTLLSIVFIVAMLVGCAPKVAEKEGLATDDGDVMEDKSGDVMKDGDVMEDKSEEVTDTEVDDVLSDIAESDTLQDDLDISEFDDFDAAFDDLDDLSFE